MINASEPSVSDDDFEQPMKKKAGGNKRASTQVKTNVRFNDGGNDNNQGGLDAIDFHEGDGDEDGEGHGYWYWRKKNAERFVESTKNGPWFTHEEHIMDAEERRPTDPNYDPSTIFIPKHDWDGMQPGMKRYWEIKRNNYDKIVFYRFGKWFVQYYQDAAVCMKYLDITVPPRTSNIVGFHESSLDQNVETMVQKGFKVAIIEQTETTEMMHKRLQKSGDRNEIRAVRREVTQIFTKGTHFNMTAEGSAQDFDTKYVLSFYQKPETTEFGFCYFDMSTLKFYVGSFEDDFTLKRFRTLTLQTRPMEALCLSTVPKKDQTISILQNSTVPPSVTFISPSEFKGAEIANNDSGFLKYMFKLHLGEDETKWPETVRILFAENDILEIQALSISIAYLKKLLLAETSLPVA